MGQEAGPQRRWQGVYNKFFAPDDNIYLRPLHNPCSPPLLLLSFHPHTSLSNLYLKSPGNKNLFFPPDHHYINDNQHMIDTRHESMSLELDCAHWSFNHFELLLCFHNSLVFCPFNTVLYIFHSYILMAIHSSPITSTCLSKNIKIA